MTSVNEVGAAGTGYASVNGLRLYYEVHGPGRQGEAPLVLLHGGLGGISMFGANLPALSARRRVIAVELQGHGRTADIDRPLSYGALADDVAALVEHLGLEQVDLLGYSFGGAVALQTAIRHPELVRRLVIVSAVCRREGWYPEVAAWLQQMGPEMAESMKGSPLVKLYPDLDLARLFTKLGDLHRKDYDWSQQVAALRTPTMLVFADADAATLEHVVEFYRLLGGGKRDGGLDGSGRSASRLAVLPGLTHYDIVAAPAVAAAVAPFLSSE